ncbi:MAG TPA: alpha/beta hydrolase [Desulfurivibrio alkaliphilus]|uniref:Alpha/beta hydrolase n=1 Tax=Desulfurivibrio alkaliphilus TaxID=427923 RepID=A0A7C2XMU2_9BACT|nr:alpha/beta hydrolase [Desulfurivibrio alkaliphilus]
MDIRTMTYEKLEQPAVRSALFCPRADWVHPPAGSFEREVEVEKGVRLPLRYHLGATEPGAVNILFFHGNGEVAADYDELAPRFNQAGLNLVVAEYRGYGRAGGEPTVRGMIRDAHQLLPLVRETLRQEGKTGHLAVMGRSLGSVAAIDLAAAAAPELVDGLIIESGISHTIPLLLALGVDVGSCGLTSEADGFCNVQKIAFFTKPTYILHAQHDQLIPVALAEALQASCGSQSKEFQIVPGADHNNIIERVDRLYFEAIARFCRKLGQPPRRKKPGVR